MLKAVVSQGEIHPLEPLPVDWQEGQPLHIEKADNGEMPVEKRFSKLVRQWQEETRFLSSIHEMVSNPAYLQIIGMGKEALPLLLNELRREPDHWFVALQAITGINPIPPSARGNVDEMAHAWLAWGKQNGL